MRQSFPQLRALLEVLFIRFILIDLLLVGRTRIPALVAWETSLGYYYLTQGLFILIVVILLLVTRRDFKTYGLTFRPLRYHLDIALTCLIPFAVLGAAIGLGLDFRSWGGALALAGLNLALLLAVAWLTRNKPAPAGMGAATQVAAAGTAGFGVLLVPLFLSAAFQAPLAASPGEVNLAGFVYYLFFVGFGEEVIYRGYAQSRLDLAFGTPFTLRGVPWGWGTLLACLIFGLTHAGLHRLWLGGEGGLNLAWAFWTTFGGLVFAYLRNKTGSVLAPSIVHGLPQAIAALFGIA
jgi:membrane protease YdiL (CAAX protease family)